MAGAKALLGVAGAGRGDARGRRFLLGGTVMASTEFSSSREPGETLGSGLRTWRRRRHGVVIFLKTSLGLLEKGPMVWSAGRRGAAGFGCCTGR